MGRHARSGIDHYQYQIQSTEICQNNGSYMTVGSDFHQPDRHNHFDAVPADSFILKPTGL